MIKINDIEYKLEALDCYWGKFTGSCGFDIKTGIAPRLFFYVDTKENSKELLLELTITDDEFKNMPIGEEIDMRKEVTDIGYSDNKGWLTLGDTNCILKVTRLNSEKFLINFKSPESFESISFEINEEIKLDFP